MSDTTGRTIDPILRPTRAAVLVVDDERVNRELVAATLRRAGYDVTMVAGGQAALDELARGTAYDLVLLDWVMPEMDGMATLDRIRQEYSAVQLPVIMCTSSSETQQVVTAFSRGASDYITKPIDVAVALARIATHVEHRQSRQALQDSQERYALAATGANDGLWDCDLRTGRVFYSQRWKEMLGLYDEPIPDTIDAWIERIHCDDRPRVEAQWVTFRAHPEPHFEAEYRMLHSDGTYRWIICRGAAVRDDWGHAVRVAGSLTDVTQAKVADPLTGLPNRLLFLDRLQRCLERLSRTPEPCFAVLFLDLDNFKLINDTFGHDVGDQLLVAMSKRLLAVVRTADSITRRSDTSVARLGGDEFTILLESLRCPEDAHVVAQRILAELHEPVPVAGTQVYASVSIGISVGGSDGRSPEDLLREADTAMYHAKSLGRNRCCMFDPQMQQRAAARLSLERDLRQAVINSEFKLQFQPIVRLHSGELVGVEALLRWRHPLRGMIPPSEFVGLAEETGLIIPIGEWVLREACCMLAELQTCSQRDVNLTMSVNCSRKQLAMPGFVGTVRRVIEETLVDPRQIKLEVTETVIMEDPEDTARALADIRALGVKIGLDDFGTGYSCLALLHRLPLDVLKIDRSFVSALATGDENLAIVRTILSLAESLKLSVVAEGIETDEQRRTLEALGCEFGQGYLFSRAIDACQLKKYFEGDGSAAGSDDSQGLITVGPASQPMFTD